MLIIAAKNHGGPQAPPQQPAQTPMSWAPKEGQGRPLPPTPAPGGRSTMAMYPQVDSANNRRAGDRSQSGGAEHIYVDRDFAAQQSEHIPLELQSWFFGKIDLERCERVLGDPNVAFGTFLIRDSTSKEDALCLSVKANTSRGPEIYSIRIEHRSRLSGPLTFKSMHDNTVFSSIEELIQHYQMNGIMTKGNVLHVGEGVTNSHNNDYNRRDRFEIMDSDITYTNEELGRGHFGIVTKGILRKRNGTTTDVALKQLKDVGRSQLEEFEKELGVLKTIYHDNIVTFYGVCSKAGTSVIVTEFMSKGDLHRYLVKHPDLSISDMVYYALAIASGMKFLESKRIIHRDLAARNVLLGDHFLVKINDFGMSRLTSNLQSIYVTLKDLELPIPWTAPEGMDKIFSPKSDVWSYGILLTEIVNKGAAPYAGIPVSEIVHRVRDQGLRMTQEELGPKCSNELYRVMQDCWQEDPERRPDFQKIFDRLSKIYQTVAPIKM